MKWTRERKGGPKRSGCKTIETKGKKYNDPDVRVEKEGDNEMNDLERRKR